MFPMATAHAAESRLDHPACLQCADRVFDGRDRMENDGLGFDRATVNRPEPDDDELKALIAKVRESVEQCSPNRRRLSIPNYRRSKQRGHVQVVA